MEPDVARVSRTGVNFSPRLQLVMFAKAYWQEAKQRNRITSINPEDYKHCASELLILTAVLSWCITMLFNVDVIDHNPLKDRLGYNNVCVGWDEPPALYVAAPFLLAAVFMMIRFSYLDQLRENLDKDANTSKRKTSMVANVLLALSYVGVAMITVVTPDRSPEVHTSLFMNLIFWNLWSQVAHFYEIPRTHHVRGSWVYIVMFGVISIGFFIVLVVQMATYDDATKERGPIPWYICAFCDYAWFVGLAASSSFMPEAPSLEFVCSRASDEDYEEATDKTEIWLKDKRGRWRQLLRDQGDRWENSKVDEAPLVLASLLEPGKNHSMSASQDTHNKVEICRRIIDTE